LLPLRHLSHQTLNVPTTFGLCAHCRASTYHSFTTFNLVTERFCIQRRAVCRLLTFSSFLFPPLFSSPFLMAYLFSIDSDLMYQHPSPASAKARQLRPLSLRLRFCMFSDSCLSDRLQLGSISPFLLPSPSHADPPRHSIICKCFPLI